MSDLEQTIAALARRVAALEEENERLRLVGGSVPTAPGGDRTPSRRGLLVGGAGLIGAFAGSSLLASGRAGAAPASVSHVVQADQYAVPLLIGTRVVLEPQRGGGHHWACYVWAMDAQFAAAEAPAVLAAAADNYHGAAARAEPTVAVDVRREGGVWKAEILVNHIGHLATAVTLNAIAFGSRQ
jgi:hypothetical protein